LYADVARERSKAVRAMSLDARTMRRLGLIERARQADILMVAQRFGALKRVGASEWALPSLRRRGSLQRQHEKTAWNCRGCGKGGDPISLVAYLANVSQGGAALLLALLSEEAQ
jgi:hypothetical protein